MRNEDPESSEKYVLFKRIVVKDMPIFDKVCMQYLFKTPLQDEEVSTLIFAKKEIIFELNFLTEETKQIYKFSKPFTMQPSYFVSNQT